MKGHDVRRDRVEPSSIPVAKARPPIPAFRGFTLVLLLVCVPVLYLLGLAMVAGTVVHVRSALALLLVGACAVGAGGVVHFVVRPLRESGLQGHRVGWILSLYGSLLGAFGGITVSEPLFGPRILGFDAATLAGLRSGYGLAVLLIAGAVLGIVVARSDSGRGQPARGRVDPA